jgi:tripeptide aminopeptidase
VNAARLASRIVAQLPSEDRTPETTRGRDGFIHPFLVDATSTHAEVRAIVRDFDHEKLEEHVELIRRTAEEVMSSEPRASFEFEVKEQYPNMRRHVEEFPAVVEAAERAIRAEGLEPVREPIRGGTDGALLSERGLPTPNLFTGGHAYHSVREWASLQEMSAAAATVVRLAGVWAELD